jgi:hypothetical protein
VVKEIPPPVVAESAKTVSPAVKLMLEPWPLLLLPTAMLIAPPFRAEEDPDVMVTAPAAPDASPVEMATEPDCASRVLPLAAGVDIVI